MSMPPQGERLLSIGEFSRLSRISIRMLRHYDEHGVLHPTRVDAFSGYRYYSPDLLRTAGKLRDLRDVGLRVGEHGYRFSGPMFNIYLVGPDQEPDPARWLTEVCAPVEAEAAASGTTTDGPR